VKKVELGRGAPGEREVTPNTPQSLTRCLRPDTRGLHFLDALVNHASDCKASHTLDGTKIELAKETRRYNEFGAKVCVLSNGTRSRRKAKSQ